jgi:hypothetical protein
MCKSEFECFIAVSLSSVCVPKCVYQLICFSVRINVQHFTKIYSNTPAATRASAAFPSATSQRAQSLAAMRAPPHIVFCCACTAAPENSAEQAQISAKRVIDFCVEKTRERDAGVGVGVEDQA